MIPKVAREENHEVACTDKVLFEDLTKYKREAEQEMQCYCSEIKNIEKLS